MCIERQCSVQPVVIHEKRLADCLRCSSGKGRMLDLDSDSHETQGAAAQSFVFAKYERQLAAKRSVRHGDCREHTGFYIFHDVGAGDESDANVYGDTAFE